MPGSRKNWILEIGPECLRIPSPDPSPETMGFVGDELTELIEDPCRPCNVGVSIYLLVIQHNHGTSPFLMENSLCLRPFSIAIVA